jgi:ACS family hexuronate transporter-like MFS transporter
MTTPLQPDNKTSPLRWGILFLLFAAGFLNYMDKGMLGLLAPTIQEDLGFDDDAYADVQNWFQVAYTIATFGSGFIVDRFGARISLAVFVGWWSLSNVLTGFANTVFSLKICRSLLGLGEAGNWTAAPKTVGDWFSEKERGLAIGVYSIGAPIGMVIAPSLIIGMAGFYGSWKAPFIVTGLAGLVWILPWMWFYKKTPATAPAAEAVSTGAEEQVKAANKGTGWTIAYALCRWEVWVLILGRMMTDPVWGFYQNWYPKYLGKERGFTQTDIKAVWIVFVGAAIGGIIGGWLSGLLIKRGFRPVRARLVVMAGAMFLMLLSPMVSQVSSANVSIILASLIVMAHLAWLTNIGTLVVDIVPQVSLAKVFGLVAVGSSLGMIGMNKGVAAIINSGSYERWFMIAGFLHITAFLFLASLWTRKADA